MGYHGDKQKNIHRKPQGMQNHLMGILGYKDKHMIYWKL